MENPTKAVVLFSGGLDSTTVLAMAMQQGYACYALTVAYGQRHNAEIAAAVTIAQAYRVAEHRTLSVDLGALGGSALTDSRVDVPELPSAGIPVTYVPARNTIMLSIALAWAEVLGANDIFLGVNAVDYSGYPDCRPEFLSAFEKVANLATKAGVEGQSFRIHAPLINLSKAEIISTGRALGVDYAATVSCYKADNLGRACRLCDACRLRIAGFQAANVIDPTRYA